MTGLTNCHLTNTTALMHPKNCPTCHSEYKIAIFGTSNYPFTDRVTAFINLNNGTNTISYCQHCGGKLLTQAREKAKAELTASNAEEILKKYVHDVPILSMQAPANWHFTPLSLVSGQSVTGTGVFSEFASSVSDLFGSQSKSYNKKLADGEELCKTQLRLKCVEAGGNAIVATDIDYTEVGGQKGMLMVCMAGTAVLLENTEVLSPRIRESIQQLNQVLNGSKTAVEYLDIINPSPTTKLTKDFVAAGGGTWK